MKPIFILFLIILNTISTNTMEPRADNAEIEHEAKQNVLLDGDLSSEETKKLVNNIVKQVWWEQDTQTRITKLESLLLDAFKHHSAADIHNILSFLLKDLIDNIGGYSGGLVSYMKGKTSDFLILAHFVHNLMKELKIPLGDNCQTWERSYNTYGIPVGSVDIKCDAYLEKHAISPNETYQDNLKNIVKYYENLIDQRKHGITSLGESGFHEIPKDVPGPKEVSKILAFQMPSILEDGFDGIIKLGIFYGILANNEVEKSLPELKRLLAQPEGSEERNKGVAWFKLLQEKLQRYHTELLNYQAIDPTNVKLTSDGTAMVMVDNNVFSIVFGGMGVGEGGMDEGKALAYKYNNPPLSFQHGLGGAHEGFFIRLTKSWDEIYNFCRDHALKVHQPLTSFNFKIIGHSMGGGVAPIAALRLVILTFNGEPGDHIKVITFGAPRSLDATLANTYNELLGKKTYMFVHKGDDYVPNQPPPLIGYIHVGIRLDIPQPNISPDQNINQKVFHQYAGYKNVLDTCAKELHENHSICATVAREESGILYPIQTTKNILLSPIRSTLKNIFGENYKLVENHTEHLPEKK